MGITAIKPSIIIDNIDIKTLIIGIVAVILLYSTIFLYVHMKSDETIKQLESALSTNIYPISYENNIEDKISHTEIEKLKLPDPPQIIKGLFEETKYGKIPIIRTSDNLTSFRAYQHPFTIPKNTNKPVISFVILDYGLSKAQSKSALDLLPSEVSFILSPYSSLPNEWIKMAQDKGHEIWLNAPIQNKKLSDSGKHTIFHHSPLIQKINSLHKTLSSAQGYVGISSYSDDSMLRTTQDYSKLADELYSRGLGYLELNPNAPSLIANKAFAADAPYIKANTNIINIKGKNSFETLEKLANKNGYAVAIVPNYPKTINNLAVWIMKVGQTDYVIAPVSSIYNMPMKNKNTHE